MIFGNAEEQENVLKKVCVQVRILKGCEYLKQIFKILMR